MGNVVKIFFDTEFTDFTNMDLISIGMVAETGQELYKENLDFIRPWASKWVQDNIYPLLKINEYGVKRYQILIAIEQFVDSLGADKVIFCADYQGDLDILSNLLDDSEMVTPYELVNFRNEIYFKVDEFTKMIGGSDTDYQNKVQKILKDFEKHFIEYFQESGEKQHHALSDAKANFIAFNKTMLENHLGPTY